MRHLSLALPVFAFLLLSILIMPSASATFDVQHGSGGDSNWNYLSVDNQTATMVTFNGPGTSGVFNITTGDWIESSEISVHTVSPSYARRIDTKFTLYDNSTAVFWKNVTNTDIAIGTHDTVLNSGTIHEQAQAGHVYSMTWYYRFHSVTWNLLITEETFIISPSLVNVQSNPNYASSSYWTDISFYGKVSGTFINQLQWTPSLIAPDGYLDCAPGTVLNYSYASVSLTSSAPQRIDFTFNLYDNLANVYSYSETNIAVATPTTVVLTFDSGAFNLTTVTAHVYRAEWYYRFHTITTNTLLTEDYASAHFQEPVPSVNTASWYSVVLGYHNPSTIMGWGSDLSHAWSGNPNYGAMTMDLDHAQLNNVLATVFTLANVTMYLNAQITVYDGSTNISYAYESVLVNPGVNLTQFGAILPTTQGIITIADHNYYYVLHFQYVDGNGTLFEERTYSVAITQTPVVSVYTNWANGLVFCIGLFGPAVLLGRLVPKYGVYVGLATMSIVITMLVSNFIGVTFVTLIITGLILFMGRGE